MVRSGELGQQALQAHAGGEEFLDHVIVQVRGDSFVVLDPSQGFPFSAGPVQFQGDAGMAGEPGQPVPVVDREPGPVPGVCDDQGAAHGSSRPGHRRPDDRTGLVVPVVQAVGVGPRFMAPPGQHRLPGTDDPADEGPVQADDVTGSARLCAYGGFHPRGQPGQRCGEGGHVGDHRPQGEPQQRIDCWFIAPAEQRLGQLDRRIQPAALLPVDTGVAERRVGPAHPEIVGFGDHAATRRRPRPDSDQPSETSE